MAAMGENDRRFCWAEFMRRNKEVTSISKPQLRAVVDALDDYMNSNAAIINAAIPQPGRSALSTSQKAYLLALVVERRYGVGA